MCGKFKSENESLAIEYHGRSGTTVEALKVKADSRQNVQELAGPFECRYCDNFTPHINRNSQKSRQFTANGLPRFYTSRPFPSLENLRPLII